MPLAPHPNRTIAIGWAILSLCIAAMIFGTFASAATYSNEYTATWSEVFDAPRRAGVRGAIQRGDGVSAIALALTAAALWQLYSHHRHHSKARKGVLLLSYPILSIVGLITGGWPAFASPLITIFELPRLRHGPDVVMFKYGILIWEALGLWMWTLALVLLLDLCRHPHPDHQCQSCGYDRSGLDAPSTCPECGAAHTSPAEATQ